MGNMCPSLPPALPHAIDVRAGCAQETGSNEIDANEDGWKDGEVRTVSESGRSIKRKWYVPFFPSSEFT